MSIISRLKEDYFKKNRLQQYKEVLRCAKCNGYRMVGVLDFYRLVSSGELGNNRILLNRHDIDTSPKVARLMFEIEKTVYFKDASATYYFRDSTIDKKLIQQIEECGYETGYHYEEIATFEKKNKLKSKEELLSRFPEIQEMFIHDLKKFRSETDSRSQTVASHGDFVNVLLDLPNHTLIQDEEFRRKCCITAEAYDNNLMMYIDKRLADHTLMLSFSTEACAAFELGYRVVMILTHPRNWKVDIIANTRENIKRLVQGIKYR